MDGKGCQSGRDAMEKNQLIKLDGVIYRVLAVEEQNVLLIDCIKRTMPKWYGLDEVSGHEICPEEELGEETEMVLEKEEDLKPRQRCVAHERFTVVAGILPFLDDDKMRATVLHHRPTQRPDGRWPGPRLHSIA